MPNKKSYITTPIFYVNGIPHIGHAYTSILSDAIARLMCLSGMDVKFLTGTDEHGEKVEKVALKNKIQPQELANKMSASFKEMMSFLNISNNDFIRTTETRHKNSVIKFWQNLERNGYIYLGKYSGWYSVRDEAFYSANELVNGLAPTGAPVEWIEEPSYFFALSKLQDKLLDYYQKNLEFILPKSKRNEVIKFVESGLEDLSISRTSFKWGIAVPGDSKHVIYVWLDALTNYLSAIGYQDNNLDKDLWANSIHVIGKDILRFHAIYWPAFLMALDIKPPKHILVHGWWTNEGEKISKSIGNVVDPIQIGKKYGVDQLRYFLLREMSIGSDGNFSLDQFITRNNSELSNKIGNLVQRILSFTHKYCDGRIRIEKSHIESLYNSDKLILEINKMVKKIESKIRELRLNDILNDIINIVNKINSYIEEEKPWTIKDKDQMQKILYHSLEMIRYVAIMLQPFVPKGAKEMLNYLSIPQENRMFKHLCMKFALNSEFIINTKPEPIFPRITK